MPESRLIVTADDVGLAPGMTAGALHAHTHGIVTAVSVAATGRAFAAAVASLRDHPGLDVGIHWTLVEESPLSPPGEVRSLLTGSGAPLPGFRAFSRRYFTGGIRIAEVEQELRRQTERLLETGLPVVHANGHQHLHVLPAVFEVVQKLADEYRIPHLRIPDGLRPAFWTPRGAQVAALYHFGRRAGRRWGGRRRTIGIPEAGHLSAGTLEKLLSQIDGVTELVCHPGLGDTDLTLRYPSWGYEWDAETTALCEPRLRGRLAEMGIALTAFSEL